MARPKKTEAQKKLEIEQRRLDDLQWKDDRLMSELMANCNRLNTIADVMISLMSKGISLGHVHQASETAINAIEAHRKLAVSIHQIRHPKSTVFIKNQVNQLAIETEQLKQQLESSKNAPLDTRSEREAEAISVRAETLA